MRENTGSDPARVAQDCKGVHARTRENGENDLIAYFRSVAQFELLSPHEERELARKARKKTGARARTKLVEHNLRLAAGIAAAFQGRGLEFPDLIQEANCGLIRAAERFNYRMGYRFSTYATFWIKAKIYEALRNLSSPTVSLDAPVGDNEKNSLSDLLQNCALPADKLFMRSAELEALRDRARDEVKAIEERLAKMCGRLDAIKRRTKLLAERARRIFKFRYGLSRSREPQTLTQLGKRFSVSPEGIRQILKSVWRDLGGFSKLGEQWLITELWRLNALRTVLSGSWIVSEPPTTVAKGKQKKRKRAEQSAS